MCWVESHICHCSRVLPRCHPERSSCSGEFGCRSLKKHSPWTVCFLPCHVKKTRVFLWAITRLKFTEHFTSRFCIRDLKTSGKSVKFDLPNYCSLQTIVECELWWFFNFDGLTILTALVLYSQSDYLNQGFWLAYGSVLYESIEHADDTIVRFGNKVCFENWKKCLGNLTDSLL